MDGHVKPSLAARVMSSDKILLGGRSLSRFHWAQGCPLAFTSRTNPAE